MATDPQPVPKEGSNNLAQQYSSPNQNDQKSAGNLKQSQGDPAQQQPVTEPKPQPSSQIPTQQPVGQTQAPQSQVPAQPAPQQPQQQPPLQQPQQQPPQQKKKNGKGCSFISCNKTTCCLGSCIGCLGTIIAVILLAIFAAPTVGKLLDNFVNSGVTVPEKSTASTADIESELDKAQVSETSQQIKITEDELNALIIKNLKETEEENSTLDVRMDIESGKANIYMRFAEIMPWAVLTAKSDSSGEVKADSIKIGPIDIENRAGELLESKGVDSQEKEEIDLKGFFRSMIFGKDSQSVQLQKVYFEKDAITIVVKEV